MRSVGPWKVGPDNFGDGKRLAQPTPVLKVIGRMGISKARRSQQLKFVELVRPFSFVRPSTRPTRRINVVLLLGWIIYSSCSTFTYSWLYMSIEFYWFSFAGNTKLDTTSPLPGTMMHIYAGDAVNHVPAENVKIGDPLTLKVALDQQEVYGMTVADCTVRDGLGWSEQLLYNDQGYYLSIFLLFQNLFCLRAYNCLDDFKGVPWTMRSCPRLNMTSTKLPPWSSSRPTNFHTRRPCTISAMFDSACAMADAKRY